MREIWMYGMAGWLGCAALCGAAGYFIGAKFRRQRKLGLIYGAAFLAPGLAAIFALPDRRPKCRYCGEPLDETDKTCRACGRATRKSSAHAPVDPSRG